MNKQDQTNNTNIYKTDCRYFRGDVPCEFHKLQGVKCYDCNIYNPINYKILIIKLGAIGDVIRTTPLLHKLKSEHPNAMIYWLTLTPEVLPSIVDKPLKFGLESVLILQQINFNKAINLDKDPYATALMNTINSNEKYGFFMNNGAPAPCNSTAEEKYLTCLFDDVSKSNTKSYLTEIFEICNYKFNGEEYILPKVESHDWNLGNHHNKKVVGLNTGCGERWTSRLWNFDYWVKLIELLKSKDYFVLLLGGKQEDDRNMQLSKITGAKYTGFHSLPKFISLMNECNTVVTAVTMGLHLAIGLRKKVILMNNIFNPNEFELYNRGSIVQPAKECKCYFAPKCKNTDDYFCLDSLTPEMVFEAIEK